LALPCAPMKLDSLRTHVQWPGVARWLVIALWATTPFSIGDMLDSAVDDTAPSWVVAIGSWAIWGATLTASLIRLPISLTTLRLGTSAGVVAAVVAMTYGDATAVTTAVGIATVTVAFLLAMSAEVGAAFVDGASYGDERRFPLRPSAMLIAGPIPLAWATFVVGVTAGPLLLASQRWISGSVATLVGWPAAYAAFRALHGLSRRWLVFVPAGVVIHDFFTSREPFLITRSAVAEFGPADAKESLTEDNLLDATQNAAGIVLMIDLHDTVDVVPRPPRGEPFQVTKVKRVAFVPTRPGSVMAEARQRKIG